jgi:hypothetical protein
LSCANFWTVLETHFTLVPVLKISAGYRYSRYLQSRVLDCHVHAANTRGGGQASLASFVCLVRPSGRNSDDRWQLPKSDGTGQLPNSEFQATYGVEITSIDDVRHWALEVAPKVAVDFPVEHVVQLVALCMVFDWYEPASQEGHSACAFLV